MSVRAVFRLNSLTVRAYSNAASKSGPTSTVNKTSPSQPSSLSVAGLSERCVKSAKEPVGPGASAAGNYKVPEYFCYDKTSFAEAEIEMAKYRCPQPSALK